MGRNIFNQPPKDVPATDSPAPPTAAKAEARAGKLPGAVGGLRDSLREITANSIRDLDPARIEMDGLRDRLSLDDSSIDGLADSIRKHGQQVPIMVRPSDQPDQYRIVYGRRRLAAILRLGGTVKAIVRTLDDDASLIAQGQENNLRLDPSFIEKALFIRDMHAAGYKPAVIQDALGLTRQGVSNHRVIVDQIPDEVIRLIGPAHGVGRRQWSELAAFATRLPLEDLARSTLAALPQTPAGGDRFGAVLAAAYKATRSPAKRATTASLSYLSSRDGQSLGAMAQDGRSVAIKVARKDHPDFCQWMEDNAEAVLRSAFDRWKKESGHGS
ncbi:hypothetical protein P775_00340 [Puniceibacterium antarcticum]|uniref:ParB-like N-terminal domain-containing protein n=1 Tax=Puniceibacterium antarcticum TaxID=1206336 RepID=A0A2G8RKX1_9RHOB|nr:plasmid partitioning protein RepB [Puniceibacterium antarcticum]PIL22207.1 hypothetical protein P775_00340 [Puniceibacterium antarcticum]